MYRIEHTEHDGGHVLEFEAFRDSKPLSYADAIDLWRTDDSFVGAFLHALESTPFSAYRWETPPVSPGSMSQAFEFVCVDSPGLSRSPDRSAFASEFRDAPVVSFANLGGDAVLVCPCPVDGIDVSTYTHLGAFTRGAPIAQQRALWREVGTQMASRTSRDEPVWLSTAGGGVAWLHVRLDDRPKYYRFRRYAERA